MAQFDEDVIKLHTDLSAVGEKIKLAREMIVGGLAMDQGLGEVLGFLEACRDTRMPELINSGTSGTISEDVFAKVLAANDAIATTFEKMNDFGDANVFINDGLSNLVSPSSNGNEKVEGVPNKNGGGDRVENLLGDESPRNTTTTTTTTSNSIDTSMGNMTLGGPPKAPTSRVDALHNNTLPCNAVPVVPKLAPPPKRNSGTGSTDAGAPARQKNDTDFDAFLDSLQS